MDTPPHQNSFQLNWLTLSFSSDLEKAFQDSFFKNFLWQIRIAFLLGIFIYSIFGILDACLVPAAKEKLWFIRYAIFAPYGFGIFLFSFSRHFKKYMQPSLAFGVLLAGLGITAMILIAPYPASYSYYAGLILVFIYGFSFLKLRFVWASVAGLLIVIAYEIATIWLIPTPTPILVNNNFFILGGNILGMSACYSLEYYLRRDFIQTRLLETEKKKVIASNAILEQRVEQRTAQLAQTNRDLIQEISERKRIEAALRDSEEKYRLLVDNADTAIFIAQDEVIKFPNPRTLDLIGYSAAEIAQMPFASLIHPDDRRIVLSRYKKRLQGKSPPRTYSFRVISKRGEELWVQLNTVLISWEGRPATLNFLKDITAEKKLETRLQQAEKMEAIGTLAGGVAHDLNNILSGLVSYPELLLLDLPEDSPLRNPILTIQESGQKAAAIVQDLLTLARRGVSVTEVVNLNQVIAKYLASPEYEKLLSRHPGIKVKTDLAAETFNIQGSPVHLSKTVMNLVSNAVEAMPEGGRIHIATENRYIDGPQKASGPLQEGEYVVLTISDTGVGIAAKDLGRIFEPFYTKKKMGRSGTGLGMAVVWGTVKDHNGHIDVHSTVGRGTTFTLYFPATHKDSETQKSDSSPDTFKGKGETILVVDDIANQRKIAAEILKKLGYEVKAVSSGEEAVGYMQKNSADLLVLDMIMEPGIDGLETYKRIIQMHPGQKALIASGYSETERVKKALHMGVGLYLKKPYSLENIGTAVRSQLEKR